MRWIWILLGVISFVSPAEAAGPQTLRDAANMGLAMNGNGTSAWTAADEALSQSAQNSVVAILKNADNRNREGRLALERACGAANPKSSAPILRMTNLSDYASMMDTFKRTDTSSPQVRMIAMNRMDGYSQGYEKGALDAWQLAFLVSPELKKRICADVKVQIESRQ